MAATSKTTTDHQKIRRWTETRGGHPATVKRTASGGDPGVLRIDFPGYSGQESLEEISWKEFFDKFEENSLAFLYQEETKEGQPSRFCKLVSRTGRDAEPTRPKKSGKQAAANKTNTPASAKAKRGTGAKAASQSGTKASGTKTRTPR